MLVTAADSAYALPAAVALLSAATSLPAGGRPACVLLGVGLDAGARGAVERVAVATGVELHVRAAPEPAPADAAALAAAGVPAAAAARLLLPAAVGDLAARSLYLDADTLTMGPVAALLAADLGGAAFGAVTDPAIRTVSHPRLGVRGWRELGLAEEAPFFNSGVLLVDHARWLAEGIGAGAVAALLAGETAAWEQGALNAAAAGRWRQLDARWNQPVPNAFALPAGGGRALGRRGVVAALPPGILHFTGRIKPWHAAYPPNPPRAAYLAAWRRLLPGEAPPAVPGAAAWAVARVAGRLAERDAPRRA